jgi:hypothetical protein
VNGHHALFALAALLEGEYRAFYRSTGSTTAWPRDLRSRPATADFAISCDTCITVRQARVTSP